MFHTHLSHLGLTELKRTSAHVFLASPDVNCCKRAMLVHGMELKETGYRLIGGEIPEHALHDSASPTMYYYGSDTHTGLVARWDARQWCAMIPLDLWDAER